MTSSTMLVITSACAMLLFGRKVDLIEEKGLRNKYLIDNINRTKQLIYG